MQSFLKAKKISSKTEKLKQETHEFPDLTAKQIPVLAIIKFVVQYAEITGFSLSKE